MSALLCQRSVRITREENEDSEHALICWLYSSQIHFQWALVLTFCDCSKEGKKKKIKRKESTFPMKSIHLNCCKKCIRKLIFNKLLGRSVRFNQVWYSLVQNKDLCSLKDHMIEMNPKSNQRSKCFWGATVATSSSGFISPAALMFLGSPSTLDATIRADLEMSRKEQHTHLTRTSPEFQPAQCWVRMQEKTEKVQQSKSSQEPVVSQGFMWDLLTLIAAFHCYF